MAITSKTTSFRSKVAAPIISCGRRLGSVLAVVAAIALASSFEAAAQDANTRVCPLPSTSEEILRTRLAITEFVELPKSGPLSAWAMGAGHAAVLDHWAKDKKAYADQAKIFFGLAPLTQWLALGRSSSVEGIQDVLGGKAVPDAKPVTGRQAYFQYFQYADTPQGRKLVEVEAPPVHHIAGVKQEVLRHIVLPSMLTHGRHKEAMELFPLSQHPTEGLAHIDFLLKTGKLDQATELYGKRSELHNLLGGKTAHAIAYGLVLAGQLERAAAFLDAELQRIREHIQAKPSYARSAWYQEEPLLMELLRLGRTDWDPPDWLFTSGLPPASKRVTAMASLISALRSAGRGEEAERHRKRVHEYLEKEAAELKERQAMGKRPLTEHMFLAIPTPATFDSWIEIEHAYAILYKGDLENAERIVRSLRGDPHARFSRSAVLDGLAMYARHHKLWPKAEELLTIATSEPLFPQDWDPGRWLAAAGDAQQAGATEVATRWLKIAGTAFCRQEPDQLQRFVSLPVGHPGRLKPFVLPFLDSLYVLMAVREARLPAYAR